VKIESKFWQRTSIASRATLNTLYRNQTPVLATPVHSPAFAYFLRQKK